MFLCVSEWIDKKYYVRGKSTKKEMFLCVCEKIGPPVNLGPIKNAQKVLKKSCNQGNVLVYGLVC